MYTASYLERLARSVPFPLLGSPVVAAKLCPAGADGAISSLQRFGPRNRVL